MGQYPQNGPWWKPGLEIFGQVSAWIVVPIVAALVMGKYLDARYETKPWIFLGLSGLGFLVTLFGLVRTVRTCIRKIEKNGKSNESK